MSGLLFSVCIFLYVISYLYSSIVETSCHFIFHGRGLLAEMPYTFVLFQNKCVKETRRLVWQVHLHLNLLSVRWSDALLVQFCLLPITFGYIW